MFSILASILKLILVFISIYLLNLQNKQNNKNLFYYWLIVAAYWLFNFLSGLKI